MTIDPADGASTAPTRIRGIDVLRGFAALLVVLSHYTSFWDRSIGPLPIVIPAKFAHYSVELFFVISGIVIFATLNRSKSTAHFLYSRLSRLYPAYWVSLWFVTFISFWLFGQSVWWAGLAANSTMFQEFLGLPNFDPVYWSLTIELAFYLNVAWIFALGWHRRVVAVCLVWLGLACLWRLTLAEPGVWERGPLAMIFALDYAHFFVIGIVLYDARQHGVRRSTYLMIAAVYVTLGIGATLESLTVASAILVLTSLAVFDKLRLLVNPLTVWLGDISFSLYLIHRNIGLDLLRKLHALGLDPALALALTISIALGLATLLTFLIERPTLRFLRSDARWSPKRFLFPGER